MKAIQVHSFGGPEVLSYEDVPDPRPGKGEVLVEVRAIGVNYADITSRIGRYRPELPWIPGNEGAGVVIQLGEGVDQVALGERVAWATAPAGLPLLQVGDTHREIRDTVAKSYAEFVVIRASKLVHLPDEIPFEIGAAAALQGMTAHYLANSAYPIKPHDRVLVHAGAGGVGLLLTQFAKQAGATVFTTVSTEEKARISKAFGADEVILYTQDDFAEVVRTLTNGTGVSVVYDSVGKATFDLSLRSLAPRGYLVLYGQSSGPVDPFDVTRLNTGSYFLTRPSFAHYTMTRDELNARAAAVFSSITRGDVRVRIHASYPLQRAADAHRELERRATIGKIILIP